MSAENKLAILGTVGVPGRYGGFETLAENLVKYHSKHNIQGKITVWCSAKLNTDRLNRFSGADLRYINLSANGVQSIPYDIISLWQAVRSGHNRILLLGVSGALVLPLIRVISKAKIITNIDGIEWKRDKWKGISRLVLRASEWAAVKFSHEVIADNQAIYEHVLNSYGSECHVIPYGGDQSMIGANESVIIEGLPHRYALSLCRIEPENNVHVILEAFSQLDTPLVFVGNWGANSYGRALRAKYEKNSNLHLLDPIFEPGMLYAVRNRASLYLHGHSAGGTNPSLVEMMHFGVPVIAYDCAFNRFTTDNKSLYFSSSNDLMNIVNSVNHNVASLVGRNMLDLARQKYTWDKIGSAYFDLLQSTDT